MSDPADKPPRDRGESWVVLQTLLLDRSASGRRTQGPWIGVRAPTHSLASQTASGFLAADPPYEGPLKRAGLHNDGRGEPEPARRRGNPGAQEQPSNGALCSEGGAVRSSAPGGLSDVRLLRPKGFSSRRHAAEAAGGPPPLTRRCAVRSHKPNGRRARALSDGDRRALSQPVPPEMTLTDDDHGFQVEGTPGSPFHVRASPPLAGYN